MTGVTHFTPELMAKRVQLWKDVLPRIGRLAVLRFPGKLDDLVMRDIEAAARQLGVQLQTIEVRQAEDLPAAFESPEPALCSQRQMQPVPLPDC